MAVNIEGLGHRIIARDELQRRQDEEMDSVVKEEIAKISNFFNNACLETTLLKLRDNLRRDYESTGNSYTEVLPSLAYPGEPAGLDHLQSWTVRICRTDDEYTDHEVPRAVKDGTGKWGIQNFPHRKRFRRFVQRRDQGGASTYFKEWGDPRVINHKTGDVLAESWESASDVMRGLSANPVIHNKLYCPRSPYGLPRYIGNLFTIYGSRAAEVVNYTTLKCNNIPALMLLATNAQLSGGSINRIKEFVEERVQGDNNYSTILVIEAEPVTEGMKDPGNMKLELKPLADTQHTDAMFVNYLNRNDDKLRQSFRLPPIYVGQTVDYNRATSESSKRLAEEQVFQPERNNVDSVFNTTLVPALGAASVLFRSNTPNVTDNYELTQLLAVAERSGGLSPHISRLIVEDVLGRELPEINPDINPDTPFTLTMLREQLNADAEIAGATDESIAKTFTDDEVLEQLRYVKSLTDQSDGVPEETKTAISHLVKLMEMSEPEKLPISKTRVKTRKVESKPNVSEAIVKDIFKVNEDERIIGGPVLVPGVVDLQGDIYDGSTVRAAAYFWLENYMDSSENGIKLMHQGETIPDAARVIQSFVLDRDTDFDVDVPVVDDEHPSNEFKTLTYPKDTWIMYARITNDALWEAFKRGDFIGWSIGGIALVQQLKQLSS